MDMSQPIGVTPSTRIPTARGPADRPGRRPAQGRRPRSLCLREPGDAESRLRLRRHGDDREGSHPRDRHGRRRADAGRRPRADPSQRAAAGREEGAGRPAADRHRDQASGQPVALVVAESFEEARARGGRHPGDLRRAGRILRPRRCAPGGEEAREGADAAGFVPRRFRAGFAAAPVRIDARYTTPVQSHAMMEPHATIAAWEGDKVHADHRQPDAESRPGRAGLGVQATEGQCPADQPLRRRWLRRQAPAAGRRDPGGAGLEEPRRPAGEGRAHPPAGLHHDDAALRHGAAGPPRRRPGRQAHGHRPRILVRHRPRRQLLRDLGQRHPLALRGAEPPDGASPGEPQPAARLLDAGAGRGGRDAGLRMRHGRTGRGPGPRSDRAAHPQRAGAGPGKARPVLDPPARALPEGGRAPLRLGRAQPQARFGARRPVDGRHRRRGGGPAQPAPAAKARCASPPTGR